MEFRRIFDTIPEQFDRYRSRYSKELFDFLVRFADIVPGKAVLELGPGTGQATEPILDTGCDYTGIELGDNFAELLKQKYGQKPNFSIIHDDFITHDFGAQRFDMIYSAATIQWIPEAIAFSKTFSLLKPGGTLAMLLLRSDYKTPNEALYHKIQAVYSAYFKPAFEYEHRSFGYGNAVDHGYIDYEERLFTGKRELTADEYAAYCGTHCDHLVIPEPYKTKFFDGLRQCVLDAGDRIVFDETYVLRTVKKPL